MKPDAVSEESEMGQFINIVQTNLQLQKQAQSKQIWKFH
jgi:hypothetical protein